MRVGGVGRDRCLIAAFAWTQDPDRSVEAFGGGWHWEALLLAAMGGAMSVAGSIWVLAFAQQDWDRTGRTARAMGRAAYAAFMLQGFPLIVAALVLRPIDVPLEIKAMLVAAGGIAGSSLSAGPWSRARDSAGSCEAASYREEGSRGTRWRWGSSGLAQQRTLRVCPRSGARTGPTGR